MRNAATNRRGLLWCRRKRPATPTPPRCSRRWVLFKLGRNEEALVQLRRAVDLIKDDATLCGHLADVLLKVGKTEEALAVLHHASELDPVNKEISEKFQKLNGR